MGSAQGALTERAILNPVAARLIRLAFGYGGAMTFRFLATLLFVVAVTATFLVLSLSQLEAPRSPAGTAFSQERAFATLSRLLKEEQPHVAGTPENAVVRDRIVEELKAAGYAPEIQAAFQCTPPEFGPGCSAVENIIALHKGTGGGKAVLATAHYDSVPAGPGVADDGAGTAVMLELARHMARRATKNDVIFLITDAEETGLRGAIAFAERHPLMSQVGVVLNVEARGASGPSMMFETGEGNANLMDLFARTVGHPSANSLTYEIYKLLPNDTDFSVYRRAGLTGFNFAFSNSASLYHSAHDNLDNLDRNSLHHHGDNAFALAEALADGDLAALKADSNSSYFDVYSRFLIVWPSGLNLPIAVLSLLAFAGLIAVHRGAFSLGAVAWSVGALLAAPVLLFGVGAALSFPLGIWPGVHPLDHPQPWPARIALTMAALFVAFGIAAVVGRRVDSRALLLVNWIVLSALAIGVAATIPGATYPFIWPVFGAAAAGSVETLLRKPGTLSLSGLIGFGLIAFFWLSYLLMLELVLGFNLSEFKILVLIPFVTALVPVLAAALAKTERGAWPASAMAGVIVVAAALIASRTPAYAPNHPRGHNVVYYDDHSGKPRWLIAFVGAPDEAYLKATGFPAHDEAYLQLGLFQSSGRLKSAADLKLAPPVLTVTEIASRDGLSVLRGRLRSGHGGHVLGIGVGARSGVRAVRLENQRLIDAKQIDGGEPVVARLWGLGTREVPIEVAFDATLPADITLYERSALPQSEEATALTQARPADSAPVHGGDVAIVFVKLNLLQLRPPPATAP